jgi:hypothetical protein
VVVRDHGELLPIPHRRPLGIGSRVEMARAAGGGGEERADRIGLHRDHRFSRQFLQRLVAVVDGAYLQAQVHLVLRRERPRLESHPQPRGRHAVDLPYHLVGGRQP